MTATAARPHLMIVANRLPVHRLKREGSAAKWEASPGGLASAVGALLADTGPLADRRASMTWVGSAGGSARALPTDWNGVTLVPMQAARETYSAYYDGMANSTLWPLYHDAVRAPEYRREWWRAYLEINRSFAMRAATVCPPGSTVWIHDYHLHLLPEMLRGLRPDVRIGFFLHIPFPDESLFAHLPWRTELIKGTLGADVVGFQTEMSASSFAIAASRYAGAAPAAGGLRFGDRWVRVGAYPISIDAAMFDRLAHDPRVAARARQYRARLGGRAIIAGVDRLDYTKGIDQRLRAYREMLRSKLANPADVVLIQTSVPTRPRANEYTSLRSTVSELMGEINGEFGEIGRAAVHGLHRNLGTLDLVALYRAADVMAVTPYRDGMNLIAKEYVATRHDDTGVLVLSEFTGAANELTEALMVNPHDIDALAATMARAVHMPAFERAARMAPMHARVRLHDVAAWGVRFLGDLEP